MLNHFMKEQWKKVFSYYTDDDSLDRPSYMPESKFSAPIVAQVILFIVNTYLLMFADMRSSSFTTEVFPFIFTIIVTIIVMALFNHDIEEWCKGGFIYLCGKVIVVLIFLMLVRTGGGLFGSRRPFFPLDGLLVLAFIFGVQFVIWCVIKSIKQVKRM